MLKHTYILLATKSIKIFIEANLIQIIDYTEMVYRN